MRCNQSFLTIMLVFYFSMVTGASGAKEKNNNYRTLSYTATTRVPYHFIAGNTDTVPQGSKAAAAIQKAAKEALPKVEIPKITPPKVNSNLFKKIADAFKFRKNATEKEKKRVIDIFQSLGVNDSIAASAENIRTLIDELSMRENQHYDSLIAIINDIKLRKPEPDRLIVVPDKDDPIIAEPSESKVVTDKDIEDLTNKMLPLISERATEDKAEKDKRAALSALRKTRYGPSVIHLYNDTAKHVIKRFILNVKNRAEVYGIHNFNKNSNYDDYKFNYLNTLIYNSLFVNGKTGNIKDLNGWDTAGIVYNAQKEGCSVVFTARIQQPYSTELFLSSTKSQKTFVDNVIYLLKLRAAKGVNIQFDGLTANHKVPFAQFIKFLSEVLKIQDPSYKVLVTIPATGNTSGYDLGALNQYTDRFLVNFSAINTSAFGPMTPLKGKNSMESILSRYLNEEVPPEKLIPSVSYIGTKWAVNASQKGGQFIQPLTYAEIRKRYDWPVYYEDESASAVMDSLNKNQAAIRSIFFDDEVSLEKKYDYIIENGLGGVTIDALGYDKGYGELWDALSYKFAVVDTLYLKDSLLGPPINTDLNFFEKGSRYLTLFGYILNNPCEICFENISDSAYAVKISRDLQELQIDSQIVHTNRTRPLKDKYRSKFEYVNSLLTATLGYLTLFILLITLICGGIYLYKIKSESEEWAWKKNAEIILIGLCVLLVISSFTYLFTNDTIPIFGATPKTANTNVAFSKDVTQAMEKHSQTDTAAFVISDSNVSYCKVDPNDDCINMPFTTLMIIITVGMLIGVLITRYLIMPLLRRNDIP